jgi:hypothetical protein
VANWHPSRPTILQCVFGAGCFAALAGLFASWTRGETKTGNLVFLWVVAAVLAVMAIWRLAIAARVAIELRRERHAHREAEDFTKRFSR